MSGPRNRWHFGHGLLAALGIVTLVQRLNVLLRRLDQVLNDAVVYDDAPSTTFTGVVNFPGGVGSLLKTAALNFTDGDTWRRVTVNDAQVTAASKVLVSTRRPDTADESADKGYIYAASVSRIGAGSFDVDVGVTDGTGEDVSEDPPNEVVSLVYLVAA